MHEEGVTYELGELLHDWYLALLTFAIAAGAINALMARLKKSLKRTDVYDHPVYQGLEPILPSAMGVVIALMTGPYVTPVELPMVVHGCAGILMGSLSSQMYNIWEHGLAVLLARVRSYKPEDEEEATEAEESDEGG